MPERLGRYVLGEPLGVGGMGRVLRAWDPEVGREVAIKVLRPHLRDDPDASQRFRQEACLTGQLEHPNIVPVHDVGECDGQVFYVMRRVDGVDLETTLRDRQLPLKRLVRVLLAVCDAVAYAHHRDVMHADLKPDNIMLGPFGEVLLLDWGLASRAGSRSQGVSGTPGFIAPERLRGGPPSAPADQWSLGAVLYRILSGHPPLDGVSVQPVVDVRLRDLDREVPDGLADITMRALSVSVADRFGDVGALAQALQAWLDGTEARERALAMVSQADALGPKVQDLRDQADRARRAAGEALAPLKGWSPVAEKSHGWALEDRADQLELDAALAGVAQRQNLRAALSLSPGLHEAHVRLATLHREALVQAEARRDALSAAREEFLLRQHDRGHHRRWLRGMGRLELSTNQPATATLHPLLQVDRQWVDGPGTSLGPTPVSMDLQPGSYVVVLNGPSVVRYPVFIQRATEWVGHVRVDVTVPDDAVFIPGGPFLAGGDPAAVDALSLRRVHVDDLLIQRFPVTRADYVAFLNTLLEQGKTEQAERLQPRDKQVPSHPLDGAPLFGRDEHGRFGPPSGAGPAWGRLPVTNLDLARARAFAASRPRWRLPNELEWEKAARGVDGRRFPWGDRHDPAMSCMVASHPLPAMTPIGAFAADVSVYGVRDLGGNVRDVCDNRWEEDGPAADGQRLVHVPAALDVDFLAVRGGAWSTSADHSRCAARFGDPPHLCFKTRGLRLVRPLSSG